MHEFGVSLRLGNMVFMVSRFNKVFGKCFEVWNQNWNQNWKVKIGKFWVVVGELDLES